MPLPTYQIGRVGQCYVKREATYGVPPTFAATNAVRHLMVQLGWNPRNRINAPDRYTHPSLLTRRTRRATATWQMQGILFPSGTLNTLPETDPILFGAFGGQANVTLATTFTGTPTTTTGSVASATGLAAGQGILIGTGGTFYVRMLTNVASLALTWSPALPAAPNSGDTCAGAVTYQLTSNLPQALTIGHYLTSLSMEMHGSQVDSLKLTLDANDEFRWDASGPAAARIRNAQAQPGAFTTVGTTPPSGLTGGLSVAGVNYDIVKLECDITNGVVLDNYAVGTSQARNYFREKQRAVAVQIDAMYSDDETLLTASENTTDNALLAQCGLTPGSIIALYMPLVEFEVPSDPDADGTNQLQFKGVAKGVVGNDEVSLIVA